MNSKTDSPTGSECIKSALKTMSNKPGVYRMINANDDVLYVGKAKNLKNRVTSYARTGNLTYRIMRMVEQVVKVETTITNSEAEALLLEANLIKKLKPRYNILLKDDKSFPYIYIDTTHPFPRISKHRGSQKKKGMYFGPFASVSAVNQSLAILQKAFLLRPCTDSIFNNRSRPCLQYQIKRCSAPCVDYISEQEYGEAIDQATSFLKGKNREVQERFVKKMEAYSEAMEYEKAAAMRDRVQALTRVQSEQNLNASGLSDADVIAHFRQGDHSCVQAMFFRAGSYFGNQPYFPRHAADANDEEILSAFMGQFYQTHTPPKEILINHDAEDVETIAAALEMNVGHRVDIRQPQRGDKLAIIKQAEDQAKAALERQMLTRQSEQKMLKALSKLLGLSETPQRIEVYDNSHIMGRYALGAMVVAGPEGFNKAAYRRFNIKDSGITPGDDYAMMREVFSRRFKRLQKDDPDRDRGQWPDVVLIDGGQGQLNAVSEMFADLGVSDVTYVAIAKGPDRNAGRETFFMPDKQPFTLPPNDPLMHYLQRLRDEAHRFAIGSHRVKRAKAIGHSDLDDVPGIGATRKRALLHYFGSKKEVEAASLSELENVPGISKKVAQTIYDYFHS